jgi:uncharacterized protein
MPPPATCLITPARKGKRPTRLLLAHGAGAPMDSPFLEAMASLVAERGITVIRFEFAYMAARRSGGGKRPPPKAGILCAEFQSMIDDLTKADQPNAGPLVVGGKSMGGRMGSLIAQDQWSQGRIAGLVCLAYPFHPSGKPETLRTAHLADLSCPTLIVQGEADALGSRTEVATYPLSPAIRLHWISGADHDLVPKASQGISKVTVRDQAWASAANAIAAFSIGCRVQ